jgi:hypothetical protein
MPEDGDDLADGSWGEWRRSVLGDLRRLGREMRDLAGEVRGLGRELRDDDADLETRVASLEEWRKRGGERSEDRKWLIGLAIVVVVGVLAPALRVLIFGGGG